LIPTPVGIGILFGINSPFEELSPVQGQVTHALLTRAPLYFPSCPGFLVRLACVKHAASVRSEPGSNSPVIFENDPYSKEYIDRLRNSNPYSFVKEQTFSNSYMLIQFSLFVKPKNFQKGGKLLKGTMLHITKFLYFLSRIFIR
jgi:hypothetical protein